MSVDENKALTRRFIQVWAPGNLSLLDELAAAEIMVIYPVQGEPVRGAVAFKQLLAHFHAACSTSAATNSPVSFNAPRVQMCDHGSNAGVLSRSPPR